MTPPILENISTWLVDWSLVTMMGNTTPPRDPNDENDENDEDDEDDEDDKDDEDDEDDKDNKDDIEDDENDDDERRDGATGALSPGDFGKFIGEEIEKWPKVVKSPAPRRTDPQLNMREA
jgi:hypothetical protein